MAAVSSFFVYCGEDGWSVDDVNRLSDSISKHRVWHTHDGVHLVDLFVVTNLDQGNFERRCRILPHDEDKYEGFWNHIHCWDLAPKSLHGDSKAIFLNTPTVGVDLISTPTLESTPECGKTENAAKSIADEDKQMVIDRQLYPIQQFDNWWNEETDYSPWYMGTASSTVRMLAEKFNDNYEQIKEDYDANAYGLQSWLECEVEPKLFWLKHASGIQTPFAVGNWEKQEERNVLWEENVRPNFNPPLDGYGWRGLGGDEDSKLFETDHEYRDVSRQVSWVTFEGDTTDILEDEYIRWWIL